MRVVPILFLLVATMFAGCLGGGPDAGPAETPPASSSSSAPAPTTGSMAPEEPTGDFAHHGHNYWGDRTEVYLFKDFSLSIGLDPMEEAQVRDNRLIVGYQEFDTQDDGDDSESRDKADTVWQGTQALTFTVSWDADETSNLVPGITFLYKPANTATFTRVEGVGNGEENLIPLSAGWADMAHARQLSRWRFAVEAYDETAASVPSVPFVARGDIEVTVRALAGDKFTIDPPHPFNFLDSDRVDAGDIERQVDAIVVKTGTVQGAVGSNLAQTFLIGQPITGWRVDAPSVIPWETNRVEATLYYNYTGDLSALEHTLGLVYTDASSTDEKRADVLESGDGYAKFEIIVEPHQTDDPYADESDWTWGIVPIVNGEEDFGGDFKGDVHLTLTAYGDSSRWM